MTTSPNRRDTRRAPDRQDRAGRQDTYDKIARGVERANPLLVLVINLLRLLEAWHRYFG